MPDRVLYLIGSAAPPVRDLGTLIELLQAQGWQVCVIVTPTAAAWIGADGLTGQVGYPVRSSFRHPDDAGGMPNADAVLACPMTFNTINKWAAGVSDNFALGVLNEAVGLRLPTFVVPYAKDALAVHPAFGDSLVKLERWGITVLPNELIRPPAKGESFLWERLVDSLSMPRSHEA